MEIKQYEEKHPDLFDYDSFMFLEGQMGLPDMVEELYNKISLGHHTVWVLDNLFEEKYKKRVHAIPLLNPDVLIFQTTMMNKDGINSIIYLLEAYKWKPKEIWQLTPSDIPIVDRDKYNVFSFSIYNNTIELVRL